MLPKSKRWLYVGFDDGAKAVKYFNAEMRKVLISRNFKHLTPPQWNKSPEPIILTSNTCPEGESGGSEEIMPQLGATEHDEMDCNDLTREPSDLEPESIRKRKLEEQVFELRKTRGIRTD